MLRDESFHPLEFDHHLFFNKDSQNPLPSSWITSNAHPIIEPVCFPCSSSLSHSSNVYCRPLQSITVFNFISLTEYRHRLASSKHPLQSIAIPL